MPQIPPEEKVAQVNGKESHQSMRGAGAGASAEGSRIADAASQLSAEDLEQLRRCIHRHHAKLFQ